MTEEEAKTKWCPFARCLATETDDTAAPAHTAYNRVYARQEQDYCTNPEIARCIGSACMAWRWLETLQYEMHSGEEGTIVSDKGYCGLAGKL